MKHIANRTWVFFAFVAVGLSALTAGAATLVDFGATSWRYVPGTAEASPADRTAWRTNGFDHSSWNTGTAPFGYGVGTPGTPLTMQGNYSSVFLRKEFTIADLSQVQALRLRVKYDDGFIVWINGNRVADDNEPSPVVYNAVADGYHAAAGDVYETWSIGSSITNTLVEGVNVLAVQGFNATIGSSDFLIDAQLDTAVADTKFSHDRGFYDAAFWLTITSATPGATIKYTLDGTNPTNSPTVNTFSGSQKIWTFASGPQNERFINGEYPPGVVVRAYAEKPGLAPTDVDTHTYIFVQNTIDQQNLMSGENWAVVSGDDYLPNATSPTNLNPDAMNTTMDPAVTDDPAWSNQFHSAMRAIPSMSIVTDYDNIFSDSHGIYHNGMYTLWERPCSVEMVETNGKTAFQIDCGIQLSGAGSRMKQNGKKSFNLKFRAQYGTGRLRERLFPDTDVRSFNSLRLRAGANDSFVFAGKRGMYIRDHFGRGVTRDMGWDAPAGLLVHLYINGMYWGVYNPTECPNDDYGADHYGFVDDEYDLMANKRWHGILDADVNTICRSGNQTAWNTMISIGSAGTLTKFQQWESYLDVERFADYMLMEFYCANNDWPGNNWRFLRRRVGGSDVFRVIAWDVEHSMKFLSTMSDDKTSTGTGTGPAQIHTYLDDGLEYRTAFADRAYKHLFNGGVLTTDKATNQWWKWANRFEPIVICESARWGDARAAYVTESIDRRAGDITLTHWTSERDRMLAEWFPTRRNVLLGQLESRGLYPSLDAPSFNQMGGEVVAGFNLQITAASGTIYYTTDGDDPRDPGGAIHSGSSNGGSPRNVTINTTTHVKARARQSGTWSALCEATFNVALAGSSLRISEIMYHPADDDPQDPTYVDDDFEFIEFKNIGGGTIDLSGFEVEGIGPYYFAPGTTLGSGSYLVLCRNHAAFTNRYPTKTPHDVYTGGLANDGEKIRVKNSDGNTLLSVQYEDRELNMVEDDLGFWPLAADGLGYSLVNINLTGDPDNPENWRASKNVHGSPGDDDPTPSYGLGIVINEVLAHSDLSTGDAIELYNTTASPIDIGGWYLSDKFDRLNPDEDYNLKKFQIPATNIPAYGRVVFHQLNVPNPLGFGIKEDGTENVYLASASGGNLNGFIIGLNLPATANGVSVGRYQTSEGLDFAVQSSRSFGSANSGPQVGPIVINEIMYDPPESGGTSNEFVELKNISGGAVDIGGWDLEGAGGYVFPPSTIVQAGSFLVLVDTNPSMSAADFRTTHSIPGGVPVLGHNFDLGNNGESMRLEKPNDPVTDPDVFIEKVCYNDKSPWPTEAAGEGPSMERYQADAYGSDPINWRASNIGGTPGAENTFASGLGIVAESSWKYHAQGMNLGTVWRTNTYSDTSWPRGDGALGYANPGALLDSLTTIVPGGPVGDRWITTYFRKEFSIPVDPGTITDLELSVRYDDGFVAYINGQEVTRQNMPGGTITNGTVASGTHEGIGWYDLDITSEKGKLVQGDNLIAVELHQAGPGSSDIAWDGKLTYSVSTLPTVDTPTIHPDGGVFTDSVSVTLSNTTSGAEIRYTTDGSTPTESSSLYSAPFVLNATRTVKAKGFKSPTHNPSSVASATFTKQDRLVQFASGTSNGGESSGTVQIEVTLSLAATSDVTVDYQSTAGGSATAGSDFTAISGTLTFTSGQSSKNIDLPILDDSEEEDNETVVVTIDSPSGALLGSPSTHTFTIIDNDTLFIAYNDLNWSSGQPSVNITKISAWATNGWSTSGELVNYADGNGVGVTLSVAGGNYYDVFRTQGSNAVSSTPADNVFDFGTIVSGIGVLSGGDASFTFTGLSPTNYYEVTIFGNRDESGYASRTARFTIHDVTSYTNTSSGVVTILTSNAPQDTAEYSTGYNTFNGSVAQFRNVNPGSDGDMLITMSSDTGGRYANAIRLKCVTGEISTEPPTAPTNLNAVALSATSIQVTWNDTSDVETGFRIRRSQDGVDWYAMDAIEVGPDVEQIVDSDGLTPHTTYYYKVKAMGAEGGSDYSNVDTATTQLATVEKIAKGSSWNYRHGSTEASDPTSAWRGLDFNGGWSSGATPIGYGSPCMDTIQTVLSMQGNYSSVFLRKKFTLEKPRLVTDLNLEVDFDDGFILWINGEEIHRQNLPGSPGDFLACTNVTTANQCGTWTQRLSGVTLPALMDTNIVAVQVFNASLGGSSDCGIDIGLSVMEGSQIPNVDDVDQDGMPDDWENYWLLGTGHDQRGDYDQDGFLNIDEWIGGTDPSTNDSYMALEVSAVNDEVIIAIPTIAASGTGYTDYSRYYALQACGAMPGVQGWLTVPGYDRKLGNGSTYYYTNNLGTDVYFWRARVWLEKD